MTDMASLMEDRAAAKVISDNLRKPVDWDSPKLARNIKKRYAAERRFKIYVHIVSASTLEGKST